jgi:hypothetical protein
MKFAQILAICLVPAVLTAADTKWIQKDYTQWTHAQAQRMLNDSPWARETAAFIGTTDEDAREFPVQSPTPRDAGLGGRSVSDGHWDGGVGRIPRGGNATLPVMVRWDSALPVREALVLTHAKEAGDTEHTLSEPDKYYVITIEGLVRGQQSMATTDPNADTADNPPNGGRMPVDINQVRQGLMNLSRLYPRDKKGIVPADVRVDQQTGTVRVYFPKDVPIEVQDKEVTFQTTYGSIKVTQRFKLKDMMYRGKLEL